MRERIERLLGFLMVIAAFLGGIVACGRYIWTEPERRHGALALAIALSLAACGWLWLNRDRGAQHDS